MPISLLISRKNGRPLKTYGVKTAHNSNMKYAFICVVIGFSCSATALRNLGIYPGLNFELNQVERNPLDNIDESSYYGEPYKHQEWPWPKVQRDDMAANEGKETKLDMALKRKLKQIFEIARSQLNNRNYNPRSLRDHENDPLGNFRPFPSRGGNGQNEYDLSAMHQALNEVRMYPPEDDFSFNEESTEIKPDEIIPDADQLEFLRDEDYVPNTNIMNNRGRYEDSGVHHNHHEEEYHFKSNEEFPAVSFKNIPVVEDPTQFGYGPSDARFHKNLRNDNKNENIGIVQQKPKFQLDDSITNRPNSATFNQFTVTTRNDQKVNKLMESANGNSQTEDDEDNDEESSDRSFLDVVAVKPHIAKDSDSAGVYIIAVVAGISAAATVGLIAVGIGWYNLQRHMKNAEETDYPSYGIVGPNKDYEKRDRDESAGDRRLAQSAQMYHYQHQKQQIIAMGRNPQGGHGSVSDTDEEEDEEGNYTVYECPGLASIEGPLEVKNPMFDDDQLVTPSQTPSKSTMSEETK